MALSLARRRTDPRSGHSDATVWRAVLLNAPTLFGRLVLLASLRDPRTGKYSHPDLQSLGPQEAERILRSCHQQVFHQWISSGLAEQKADLSEYLRSMGGPRDALPYRNLAPVSAREVERQLYLTDLETLLELLRYENAAAFSKTPKP